MKFCPKSKRAQLISPSYLAEPVQKAYQLVFASMELLKIVLTFYPRESNNYPANSQCLPVKSTLDATFCKLHLKCCINMPNMLLMYESLNRRGIETQIVHHPNFCAEIAMLFSCKMEDSQISLRLYIFRKQKIYNAYWV